MANGDEIEHGQQPATGIHPIFRLTRLSKSGTGIGLGHWFRIRRNHYRDNRLARAYWILTTTVSAAPVASITVSLTKPGPGGSTSRWRRLSIAPAATPLTIMVIGSTPPATLTGMAEKDPPSEPH